jgi:flagellar biosynthetic protein FliR
MEQVLTHFQLFMLIFARIIAMLEVMPILSSDAVPQIAKVGISLFVSLVVFPIVVKSGYAIPPDLVHYVLLLAGEILIGIIIGFFLVVVYSCFQFAGELFSFQMGISASEVFDPLAQIELPIIGQFFNLVGLLVFLAIGGLDKFMLRGVVGSFDALRAIDIVAGKDHVFTTFMMSLGKLFEQSLAISFPILGTLLIISVMMGLFSKAAPQMNLLLMGFPVTIGIAFIFIFVTTPFLLEEFSRIIDASFESLSRLILLMKGAG